MTYANAHAAIIIIGIIGAAGLLLGVTRALVHYLTAEERREEAWRKFKWGDWA